MNRIKALQEKLQSLADRAMVLHAQAEHSDAEAAEAEALPGQMNAIRVQISQAQNLETAAASNHSFLNDMVPSATASGINLRPGTNQILPNVPPGAGGDQTYQLLKKSRARTKYMLAAGLAKEEARATAYGFGMWLSASLNGNQKALQFCHQNGFPVKRYSDVNGQLVAAGQIESVNEDGGFLVPPEFESVLIDLREMFGVVRKYLRNTPMGRDTKNRPRRKSGLTAYFKGETAAATASKMGWDDVMLIAKKLMVLTRWSTEWDEDSIIDAGDTLAGEIAYAFSKKEDQCGFIGDGSATYSGMVGVTNALYNVYGAGGGAGLILGSGNAYSELTLPDFSAMVGALPEYADGDGVRWFMHKSFYANVCLRLMLAAGGVTAAEIASGAVWKNPYFLGYAVQFSQVMPKVAANSQVPCVLGDLALAGDFGDRRQTTIATSADIYFESDELAIRGTERFDINIHDVGDATDAGPVVGLVMAAN